jgi:hypothetical protein
MAESGLCEELMCRLSAVGSVRRKFFRWATPCSTRMPRKVRRALPLAHLLAPARDLTVCHARARQTRKMCTT